MSSKELYIGNLDPDTKSQEIKDIFERYGTINRCEVKFGASSHSAAFGFVAFESSKDAEVFHIYLTAHYRTVEGDCSVSAMSPRIYSHQRGLVGNADSSSSSSFLISPSHSVDAPSESFLRRRILNGTDLILIISSYFTSYKAHYAQRKEHGRSHRGRRLIVEFSRTTPGQNGRRGRYVGGGGRMRNGNGDWRDRSRSRDRSHSRDRYRRRRSSSNSRRSSSGRSSSSDDRHRKRDHSSSSPDRKSSSKQRRSSSSDDKDHTSHSHKNENSKKS